MREPAREAGMNPANRFHWPRGSSRYPKDEAMLPGTRPTALLIVATTGGTPKATSTGKVMRVPDPTTALIPPAPTPARR